MIGPEETDKIAEEGSLRGIQEENKEENYLTKILKAKERDLNKNPKYNATEENYLTKILKAKERDLNKNPKYNATEENYLTKILKAKERDLNKN
eukprot:CAMPEP_0205807486 /NCGR_PEP_ID=MMETSP0205-20121125/11222_1 /ASSEMBLY_ACC=CAM_ASM_000278 /TAXON_ID=36767 /ORGANISM="Euplotes focardii, Strain TN1" /LENGTH=93 /DNA_ID=CAMNT_0053081777 /DNA_START=189 /DNA_END=467 /DNA_ORIENTATION=-